MRKRKRHLFDVLAVVAVLAASAAWCSGQETEKAADPSPPVLKVARWQYLDRKYQDVFIDGSGRAWFLIREYPSSTGGKRPTMVLTCQELPEDYIEIPGDNYVIGFDSKDRFWEVGKYGLCCTDVRTGKFFEVKLPAASSKPSVPQAAPAGGPADAFGAVMLEHSSGRLYFVESRGVLVLDGDKQSYQELLPAPKRWAYKGSDYIPYCSVKLVEGPDGRVFVYIPGEYLNAVFVHDGHAWKTYTASEHPELNRPDEIVPLDGGWVQVKRERGISTRVKLYEPDETAAARPAPRQARGVNRYDRSYLAGVGQELVFDGAALGADRHGRVYFTAYNQEIFAYARLAVLDPRQPDTEPTLRYDCVPMHRRLDSRAFAVDSLGGIWARLTVEDHSFLSRYFEGKWTHVPDPLGTPSIPAGSQLATWDDIWVVKPPSAGAYWLPDFRKETRGVPSMANPALLQSLKKGGMIASERFGQRAFLFDGQRWRVFDSLKALVEARYQSLKDNLDNRGMSWRELTFLGLDRTGRVWLSSEGKRGFSGAYDGTQWRDIPKGPFEFNAAGDRCLCGEFLLDTSVWPPKELTKSRNYAALWGRLRTDGQGNFVPTDPFAVESYTPNASEKNPAFVKGIAGTGDGKVSWVCYLTLEKTPFYNLQAIWPDGGRSKPFRHPFRMNHQVVNQGANVYWAAAADGLLRLRLEGKGDKSRVVLDKLYPRIIPQGAVTWMAVGADGALWMATQDGKSGLYRIEIPPITEGKR